jgi:hypothetical protein
LRRTRCLALLGIETAAKFLYDSNLAITKLADSKDHPATESLGWDDLVALKRKLSGDLKNVTEKIIDIDRNKFPALGGQIRDARAVLDALKERIREIDNTVDKNNANLLAVSEKIAQSKNFLSVIEARLPSESEQSLQEIVSAAQSKLTLGSYRNEREKNEIMSASKDASMKLEAIKATRVIKDQFSLLTQESSAIGNSQKLLEEERSVIISKIAETNSSLDKLYDGKRMLVAERESGIADYDKIAREFDLVNVRLDSMSEMRRKQREEYGHGLPSDALFKVKEIARKKLESGGKLTFEELKLLYGEKD